MVDEATSIYQVFIRNFTEEGTFDAAAARLDEIKALGFDWVYLTPIQPIGTVGRKGKSGSPYAIADYRALNPELGTMADFEAFVAAAHRRGLKVMLDVVYNHTSPDSVLARERPEWFLHDRGGVPTRKCADWSDVVDLDYGSSPELWIELIDTLAGWRDAGVDGFRCDVASLVPADFWRQARQRINLRDPATKADTHPVLWLAESTHPHFLKALRDSGHGAWSDAELHAAAFDLTYDYDGWEKLEPVWKGERPARYYLEYLFVQETSCPAGSRKIRFLENHDQERAASRFRSRASLEAWTVLSQFVPGVSFAYMGQEYAIAHKPDLFDRDPVDWARGDREFFGFFRDSLAGTRRAKSVAPFFAWRDLGQNCVLLERFAAPPQVEGPAAELPRGGAQAVCLAGGLRSSAVPEAWVLVNLDGVDAYIELPEKLEGSDVLGHRKVALEGRIKAPKEPLLVLCH